MTVSEHTVVRARWLLGIIGGHYVDSRVRCWSSWRITVLVANAAPSWIASREFFVVTRSVEGRQILDSLSQRQLDVRPELLLLTSTPTSLEGLFNGSLQQRPAARTYRPVQAFGGWKGISPRSSMVKLMTPH